MSKLEVIGLQGIPMIQAGDDIAALILAALSRQNLRLATDDVLVIAQKIVSKAEDRMVRLADIKPDKQAMDLSVKTGKDPRLAALILQEITAIVRTRPGVAIVEHRLGLVHANAGIDQSNIEQGDDEENACALLLPLDPDGSAARLRQTMTELTGVRLGIIISDSTGRPWRLGTVPIAIGAAGVTTLIDQIGQLDLFNRELTITVIGLGDQIAAAAGILMGESDEACPVVLVRGLAHASNTQNAATLIRPKIEDMFR